MLRVLSPGVIWVTVRLLIHNISLSHSIITKPQTSINHLRESEGCSRWWLAVWLVWLSDFIYLRILSYPSLGRTSTTYKFKDFTILHSLEVCFLFKTKGNCLVRVLTHLCHNHICQFWSGGFRCHPGIFLQRDIQYEKKTFDTLWHHYKE